MGESQGVGKYKKNFQEYKNIKFAGHNIFSYYNSRKSVSWSAVPVPCRSWLCLKFRREQGTGPKEVDNLCFHTYGEFEARLHMCESMGNRPLQSRCQKYHCINAIEGNKPKIF